MTKAQSDYINLIAPYAIQYAQKYGFPFPSICIAQAIHESGWGKSTLALQANNHHGLKNNHGGLCDKSFVMNAVEEVNGQDVIKKGESWCKFDSLDKGVEGYYKYLTVWTHYAPAFGMHTWEEALKHISKTYATRSTYYTQVAKIVTDYNLSQYDECYKPKKYHFVKKGESLAHIAEIYYNNYKKYTDIYKANQKVIDERNAKAGTPKYTIYVGQKLLIP